MKNLISILKLDYLQRTRSYAFLITLCASLAVAYTFVPEPDANYSTIRIADHIGYYNSAWFGYVTAIMTSIFLSLIGFYLVNNGLQKDRETQVGVIISATPISNLKYLFSKTLSNFLILATIVFVVLVMSLILFMFYNDGYPLELLQFVKPYLLITAPSMFFIAVLAVVFEVIFGRYSVLQNVLFFFLFSVLLVNSPKSDLEFSLDVFGSKIVTHQMEEQVRVFTNNDQNGNLSIGYNLGNQGETKRFTFEGIDFPSVFIVSRMLWIFFGISLIIIVSPLFKRFNHNPIKIRKPKITEITISNSSEEIPLSKLPILKTNFGIAPILKTELLLMFRKGKKWLWFLNLTGIVLLAVLPIKVAHQIVLPILWFLQVHRLSDITTKEAFHNVHYFTLSSFKPINRLLLSQLLAGVTLMTVLATPLVIRYLLTMDFLTVGAILLGGVFIVFLAASSGILLKGKKLFEVGFFLLTYANINGIPILDYFGGFDHYSGYVPQLLVLVMLLAAITIVVRKRQLNS